MKELTRDQFYKKFIGTDYDEERFCHHHLIAKEELWKDQLDCVACFNEYHEHITTEKEQHELEFQHD